MTVKEFSDQFDTLLNSYAKTAGFGEDASKDNITLDEYEKSVYLNRAQKQFIVDWYTGTGTSPLSFEEKEIVREALDNLIVEITEDNLPEPDHKFGQKRFSVNVTVPSNLLWIIFEQATYADDTDCVCADGQIAEVVPATHDELHRRLKNPFRGPRLYRVLRLNAGPDVMQLVSDYPIGSYMYRYIEEPQPIILTDLTDDLSLDYVSQASTGSLPDIVHPIILDMAVRLALQAVANGTLPERK